MSGPFESTCAGNMAASPPSLSELPRRSRHCPSLFQAILFCEGWKEVRSRQRSPAVEISMRLGSRVDSFESADKSLSSSTPGNPAGVTNFPASMEKATWPEWEKGKEKAVGFHLRLRCSIFRFCASRDRNLDRSPGPAPSLPLRFFGFL